jgi:hypothetical protein
MSPGLRPPSLFRCATQRITLGNKRLSFANFEYRSRMQDQVVGALSVAA